MLDQMLELGVEEFVFHLYDALVAVRKDCLKGGASRDTK